MGELHLEEILELETLEVETLLVEAEIIGGETTPVIQEKPPYEVPMKGLDYQIDGGK